MCSATKRCHTVMCKVVGGCVSLVPPAELFKEGRRARTRSNCNSKWDIAVWRFWTRHCTPGPFLVAAPGVPPLLQVHWDAGTRLPICCRAAGAVAAAGRRCWQRVLIRERLADLYCANRKSMTVHLLSGNEQPCHNQVAPLCAVAHAPHQLTFQCFFSVILWLVKNRVDACCWGSSAEDPMASDACWACVGVTLAVADGWMLGCSFCAGCTGTAWRRGCWGFLLRPFGGRLGAPAPCWSSRPIEKVGPCTGALPYRDWHPWHTTASIAAVTQTGHDTRCTSHSLQQDTPSTTARAAGKVIQDVLSEGKRA